MTPAAKAPTYQKRSDVNTFWIAIAGMTDDVSVMKVQRAITGVLGVQGAHVKVGRAIVAYDPTLANENKLRNAIRSAGFVPAID